MAQTYLLAELEYLADELRNPLTALSRIELADLAHRAWRDAASLNLEPIAAQPTQRETQSSATIIPFRR